MEMRKQEIWKKNFCESVKLIKRSSIDDENIGTTSRAILQT